MSCLRRRVELSYKQYKERKKDNATEINRRATGEIGETSNIVRSSEATEIRNSDGDRYATESGSVYRQTLGEKLRSDAGRSVSTVDRGIHGDRVSLTDDDVQYQSRRYLEDDYSTDGVHWGIEEGIITKSDARVVWQAIADIQKRGYNSYPKTVYGDYFVESGNKLMVVNADYRRPTVKTIFVFDDINETDMAFAKECLINAQGIQSRLQDAWDTIRDFYGEEYATRYDREDSSSYERKNTRGKGTDSGTNNSGTDEQYQQRTDTLTDRRAFELSPTVRGVVI